VKSGEIFLDSSLEKSQKVPRKQGENASFGTRRRRAHPGQVSQGMPCRAKIWRMGAAPRSPPVKTGVPVRTPWASSRTTRSSPKIRSFFRFLSFLSENSSLTIQTVWDVGFRCESAVG